MINKYLVTFLATAPLAAASLAQTTLELPKAKASVTIYGIADVYGAILEGESVTNPGLPTEVTTTQDMRGFNSGGWAASRLGFKGSKLFDNGLEALFTVEAGNLNLNATSATNDNGLSKTRKSFIGLAGPFGRVIAGRLQTPSFDWSNEYDAGAGVFSPLVGLQSMAGVGINSFDRVNNSITWTSPKWQGLTGLTVQANAGFPQEVQTSTDDGIATNHKQSIYQLHANYAKGPFSVGAVMRHQTDTDGVCAVPATPNTAVKCSTPGSASLQDGRTEWSIGAWYDFTVAKVYATYQVQDKNNVAADTSITQIGTRVPVSAQGTIVGTYGFGKTGSAKADGASIAYTHDLDKSTKLYAGWVQLKNADPRSSFGTISVGSGVNITANKYIRGIAAGLSYTF